MTSSDRRSEPKRLPWLDRLPLLVVTAFIGAVLMLLPAAYAGLTGDDDTARPFLYGAILFGALSALVGLSVVTRPSSNPARGMLLSLVGTYLLLPAMLAMPVVESVGGLSFRNAYVEMVSCLTTTGATVFDPISRAPDAVHLWRALVGWFGGFVILVAAIAVLAPMRIGGFEIVLTDTMVGRDGTLGRAATGPAPMLRIRRFARDLVPVYAGLTLALWVGLLIAGEAPLVAFCHALSVLATSGISPLAGLADGSAGRAGEAVVALGLVVGLSRALLTRDMPGSARSRPWRDPELRLALVLVIAVPVVIFGHHWVAALAVDGAQGLAAGLKAAWGSGFMTLSFLSTAGFVSADWTVARDWSGLTTPGLILLGLAIVGGGVATTAGGVKLLRVYVLYRYGRFELDRLVYPSLVASPGASARRFRIDAAYVAWLYFMTFALSIATLMVALSLRGIDFETNLVLVLAALTTTGPLLEVAGETPIALGTLDPWAQIMLCMAMVLGRLETLALIALFNPAFWRA